jgi:hypothetical protein
VPPVIPPASGAIRNLNIPDGQHVGHGWLQHDGQHVGHDGHGWLQHDGQHVGHDGRNPMRQG